MVLVEAREQMRRRARDALERPALLRQRAHAATNERPLVHSSIFRIVGRVSSAFSSSAPPEDARGRDGDADGGGDFPREIFRLRRQAVRAKLQHRHPLEPVGGIRVGGIRREDAEEDRAAAVDVQDAPGFGARGGDVLGPGDESKPRPPARRVGGVFVGGDVEGDAPVEALAEPRGSRGRGRGRGRGRQGGGLGVPGDEDVRGAEARIRGARRVGTRGSRRR